MDPLYIAPIFAIIALLLFYLVQCCKHDRIINARRDQSVTINEAAVIVSASAFTLYSAGDSTVVTSIRSTSVPTQPPGNPDRVAHFNLTTPGEDTTETTGVIIPSGPPRYPYSAAEVASWESPDISPPQDAPPPSYDDLFKS